MKYVIVSFVLVAAVVAPAAAAAQEPHECVSRDGVTIRQTGTASCSSVPGGNIAVARGDGAHAVAGEGSDTGNHARAVGVGARAEARGTDVTAIAKGDGASVIVGGVNSRARAFGVDASVGGDVFNSDYLADGVRARISTSMGRARMIRAVGDDASATIGLGFAQTVVVNGEGALAHISRGSVEVLAKAVGDGAEIRASRIADVERLIAVGDGAFATIINGGGDAIARGTNARADGTIGTRLARAIGENAHADGSFGGRAIARGRDAFANARYSNTAIAIGAGARADTNGDFGISGNVANAIGNDATASTTGGTGNIALALTDGASATAGPDDDNTAVALSRTCDVTATGGVKVVCP